MQNESVEQSSDSGANLINVEGTTTNHTPSSDSFVSVSSTLCKGTYCLFATMFSCIHKILLFILMRIMNSIFSASSGDCGTFFGI